MNDTNDTDTEIVDLKYDIYTEESSCTLYVKFNGFNNVTEMETFALYIEDHLPLLLFNSDTKH